MRLSIEAQEMLITLLDSGSVLVVAVLKTPRKEN
jgi:hypothetical protein